MEEEHKASLQKVACFIYQDFDLSKQVLLLTG